MIVTEPMSSCVWAVGAGPRPVRTEYQVAARVAALLPPQVERPNA
jgi:hypothetical protein